MCIPYLYFSLPEECELSDTYIVYSQQDAILFRRNVPVNVVFNSWCDYSCVVDKNSMNLLVWSINEPTVH